MTVLEETAVTLTAEQVVVMADALADAEKYRRDRAAGWCADCESRPEGACPDHVDDLDAVAVCFLADAYRHLAVELGLPESREGRP